ncbi:hypothetical protein DFJ67_7336 [Asanoa ferruginea]|uniref:Uncharacterized protein n=1 Tax=Asanoa ferruginea TaxID=53367 RepID=A0A3D9ZVM3_9ACTN|nr:hypothetical protein [Asanoa ferruginea]REG01256.1 hypothetical protein DFJ67_7336 [Asanoa ferruginea]GIF53075.1 hypothetical protein Afe04nite_76140 [Asanoa ferruginea]
MVDARHPEVLVDLDRPPPQRPTPDPGARLRVGWERARAARVPIGAVVLAALVGALAGGFAVHHWQRQQQKAEAATIVSISAQLLDSSAAGGSSDGINASLVANLTLVNLGPLPIWVEAVEAKRDGLEFRNTAPEAMLRPGFRTVAVWITYACTRGGISTDPLPVRMRIRTSDGAIRDVETTVEIGGSQWPLIIGNMCRTEQQG